MTFYQQLRSQGSGYGILLLPISDIRPDCDLCPPNATPIARKAMTIAIYMKLQDNNCISPDYAEAQNAFRQ